MEPDMSHASFSPTEQQLLEGVLDELIPRSSDGRLQAAGEIGLVASIDEALAKTPAMRPVIEQGLATMSQLVRERGHDNIAAMPAAERAQAVKELESKDAGFLLTLMFLAYPAYYEHPKVLTALGLEPRPPYPQGYAMKTHDLTLLDPVRARPKMFRGA